MKLSKECMCRCLLFAGSYCLIFIFGAVWYRGNYFPYHQLKAVMDGADQAKVSHVNVSRPYPSWTGPPLDAGPLELDVEKATSRATARIRRLRSRLDASLSKPSPTNYSSFHPKTELDRLFIPLEQEIAKLSLTAHRRDLTIISPTHKISDEFHVSAREAKAYIDIQNDMEVESIMLVNTGDRSIINPKFSVNGLEQWHDIKHILDQILHGHREPRNQVKEIFKFVVENREHDEPMDESEEAHDPVKFFNVYGYGFCDDAATNFAKLVISAGMPARILGLPGHVVAEVYYDGGWHLFDPDGEVYYSDPVSGHIFSYSEIRVSPNILKLSDSPIYPQAKLVQVYTSGGAVDASPFYLRSTAPPHRMNYKLRPGESFCRYRNGKGWFFTNFCGDLPTNYSNAIWRFSPRFDLGPSRSGCTSYSNVSLQKMGGRLTFCHTDGEGSLVYKFDSPWPYITAKVNLSGSGAFKVDFSEDGQKWTQASKLKGEIDVPVSLGQYFPNGFGNPLYTYWLRIRLEGCLHGLSIESIVQTAPKSFPKFKAGDNEIHYSQESPNDGNVVLTLELAGPDGD